MESIGKHKYGQGSEQLILNYVNFYFIVSQPSNWVLFQKTGNIAPIYFLFLTKFLIRKKEPRSNLGFC